MPDRIMTISGSNQRYLTNVAADKHFLEGWIPIADGCRQVEVYRVPLRSLSNVIVNRTKQELIALCIGAPDDQLARTPLRLISALLDCQRFAAFPISP